MSLFSCAAISIGVRHASTLWLIWLSLSPLFHSFILSFFLSVWFFQPFITCLYFLTPPYFASDIAFTCSHSNSLLCIHPMLMFFHNHILLWWFFSSFIPSVSHYSNFLPHSHTSSTCDFFSLHMSRYLPWLDISLTTPHYPPPIAHWMASLLRPPLPAPTPLSPPLSLYLARRTSFPPWVLQTPVWKLKVEGEEEEEEEEEEER